MSPTPEQCLWCGHDSLDLIAITSRNNARECRRCGFQWRWSKYPHTSPPKEFPALSPPSAAAPSEDDEATFEPHSGFCDAETVEFLTNFDAAQPKAPSPSDDEYEECELGKLYDAMAQVQCPSPSETSEELDFENVLFYFGTCPLSFLPGLLAELVKQCTLRGVFQTGKLAPYCERAEKKTLDEQARFLEALDIIESDEEDSNA